MLRRVGIGLAIALGLALVATVAVVASLNDIIDANRDRIVAGISEGFARPVQVDRIATGFHGGIAMELRGLRIADDPAFSKDDFLAAERAYAVVRFWPLLERRIEVRRIAVRGPRLTIVRTAKGMNVDTLGRRAGAAKPPSAAPAAAPAEPAATGAAVPALAVALVNLEDGIVRYVDKSGPTPSETTIAPLNVKLSDLSLTTPMRMEIDATTLGTPPATFRLRGTVGPIGDPPFAADVPIEHHIAIRSGGFEVADLTITGRVRRMESGAPDATVRIAAPAMRAGTVELSGVDVTATERDGIATLERLAFRVFGGTIEGKGRVDHKAATPAFAFETAVHGLDVSQAMAARVPDMAGRFEGRLEGNVVVSGSAGDEAVVRRTLTGKGRVIVRDGRLRDINIAESVLEGATGIGGLVTLVPPRVRERYPAIFATDDTRFDELASEVRIGGERIHVDAMNVAARDYAVRGKGVITFAREADLTATLTASAPLTGDVVGALKEAAYLTDSTGRLSIPFRFAGVLPNVRPKPDADFIARVLEKALVGQGLERLLGGGGKPSDPKQPSNGKGTDELIKRGLDKLFGR